MAELVPLAHRVEGIAERSMRSSQQEGDWLQRAQRLEKRSGYKALEGAVHQGLVETMVVVLVKRVSAQTSNHYLFHLCLGWDNGQ